MEQRIEEKKPKKRNDGNKRKQMEMSGFLIFSCLHVHFIVKQNWSACVTKNISILIQYYVKNVPLHSLNVRFLEKCFYYNL
jgi:hypothetical protein